MTFQLLPFEQDRKVLVAIESTGKSIPEGNFGVLVHSGCAPGNRRFVEPEKWKLTMAIRTKVLVPSPEKLRTSIEQLSVAAQHLNEASDQLTKEVGEIEAIINRLNAGVDASVDFQEWRNNDGMNYELWRLSYRKTSGRWGFAIEYLKGNEQYEDEGTHEIWAFKDAPRDKRSRAVDQIPDLIDEMAKVSHQVAAGMKGKVEFVQSIASGLRTPAPLSGK